MEGMNGNEKYLILGIRKYQFNNDEGETIRGIGINYVDPSLSAESMDFRGNSKGFIPLKINTSNYEMFSKFEKVPGYYYMKFTQRPGAQGKPQIVLQDVEFTDEIEL